MRVLGLKNIFAIGDATATKYAPTAQVASQQGAYLAAVFNKLGTMEQDGDQLDEKLQQIRTFKYTHYGSLA
jgi:NADH:ubiquinone reductase (non-electrogenic)